MRRPFPAVALLLAGQIRTLEEPQMLRETRLRVVNNLERTAVFAHLSPEHSYTAWHNWGHLEAVYTKSQQESVVAEIRRALHPRYLEILTDDEVKRHREWSGPLGGDVGAQSVLFFRWYLLYTAMEAAEVEAQSCFKIVIRMRPDLLLGCTLEHAHLAQMFDAFDALMNKDLLLVMTRKASSVALRAYQGANTSWECNLKVELCVDALLLRHNFSLGVIPFPVAILRPAALCAENSSALTALQLAPDLGCQARSNLASHPQPCRGPAPVSRPDFATDVRLWQRVQG
jgi:hypothetical protein